MQTLTHACKTTGQPKEYIMHLISKGSIEYAHDRINNVFIVRTEDILYHVEQVRLRRLGTPAINRVKHERLMAQANVSQSTIDLMFAQSIKPIARSRKFHD